MTKIIKKIKLDIPASYSQGNNQKKRTLTNPYTQSEFYVMVNSDAWFGGWVEGLGYVIPEIEITSSWLYGPIGAYGSNIVNSNNNGGGIRDNSDEEKTAEENTYDNYSGDNNNIPISLKTGFTTARKERATAIIKYYQGLGKINKQFFVNIGKERFLNELLSIINNPSIINQGLNGTCGAAVICKFLADFYPDKFVEAAVSIFMKGQFDEWGLTMSDSSKYGTYEQAEQVQGQQASAADLIMQGAFVNSGNAMLAYNPFTDKSGVRSFMWPTYVESFFSSKLGLSVTECELEEFDDMCAYNYNDYYIIALVEVSFVSKDINGIHRYQFFTSLNPSKLHYIQLTGVDGNELTYWNWGSNNYHCIDGCAYCVYKIRKP